MSRRMGVACSWHGWLAQALRDHVAGNWQHVTPNRTLISQVPTGNVAVKSPPMKRRRAS